MKNEDLKKIQDTEVEILDEVVRLCNKHKLTYFLCAGTCLGAYRHQGFIPWDDDIDIAMPRDDYEKFIDIAIHEIDDKYFIQNYQTEEFCCYPFTKIRKNNTTILSESAIKRPIHGGIWIDIFPMDYVNKDSERLQFDMKMYRFYKSAWYLKCGAVYAKELPIKTRIVARILSILKGNTLKMKMRHILTKRNNLEHNLTMVFSGAYNYKRELIPVDKVFPPKKLKFEGKMYNVYHDIDYYLNKLYGDYMQLPPEEKRVTHNPKKLSFNEGDNKNSYEEYNKLHQKNC